MQDFLALIETVPGQVTVEVFAAKANMTQDAMRAELLVNGPLAQYFCQIVAKAMREAAHDAASRQPLRRGHWPPPHLQGVDRMTDRVICSKCGADEVICYLTAETAICPNCCEDHEYEYERSDRTHYCQHCGAEPPPDWYYSDDDVGFWSPPSTEPIGTPASEMDGNASVANASRENRRKWDNWVSFCDSWGHP